MKEYRFRKMINKNGVSIGCMEYTIPDNAVKQIRADAFEDFIKALEEYQRKNWINNLEYGITFADIEQVAEQLKAGEENDRD